MLVEQSTIRTITVSSYDGYQPILLLGQKGIFGTANTYPIDDNKEYNVEYSIVHDNRLKFDFEFTALSATKFKFKWPSSTRMILLSYNSFSIEIE